MKKFILTCGKVVLLDDEDYDRLPTSGWYISSKDCHNPNTDYAEHDEYGKMHRWVLGIKPNERPNIVVDHINHNGLDNRKENLRLVTTSENKKNITTHYPNNSLHYCGVNFERQKEKPSNRFKAKWSEGTPERHKDGKMRGKQRTKSFSFTKQNEYECADALKQAILYRNNKCKENGYILDERSTTIEQAIINNPNLDIFKMLDINKNDYLY